MNSLLVLCAVVIATSDMDYVNEVIFGLIVLGMLRMIYFKFFRKEHVEKFEIETQYDKLSAIVWALFGIGSILVSLIHYDFMVKFNLEWINYLIIGLFLIYTAFNLQKSVVFISKNSQEIEVEDYTLLLNDEVQQIQLFSNRMIVSKSEGENYEFSELIVAKEDQTKLTNWIHKNMPNARIEVNWNEHG